MNKFKIIITLFICFLLNGCFESKPYVPTVKIYKGITSNIHDTLFYDSSIKPIYINFYYKGYFKDSTILKLKANQLHDAYVIYDTIIGKCEDSIISDYYQRDISLILENKSFDINDSLYISYFIY